MTTQAVFEATATWTKVWNFATQGEFYGVIQQNGGQGNLIYHIKNTAPEAGDGGLIAGINPTPITMTASGDNLWVRTGGGTVTGILNPVQNSASAIADIDAAIGGTDTAAAGDTGPSTTNGFLRWIRDKLYAIAPSTWMVVGGAAPVGYAPTANPVGVSGIDGSGLKRSLLTDSIGQMMTTEQDSAVFTASASSASVLFTVDMSSWRSCMVQVLNAGTSCTITYEGSNDQSTWNTVVGLLANPNTATAASSNLAPTTSTSALAYQFPKRYKYFRARVSVYGSGTVSVSYCLSASEVSPVIVASVLGQVAEGAAFSGNPVTIGVECRTTRKTAVANGQIVRPIGTVDGKLIVRPHSIPENEWKYMAVAGGIVNTTTAVQLAAAGGTGLSVYITSMQLQAEALTNATEVAIRDGAGGTVVWRSKIDTSGLPLTQINFEDPIKGTANTLLEFVTLTASGAGAVYVNAQGYYAP